MDLMFIPIHVNVKAVRLLLAYGADPTILYCRKSALDICSIKGWHKIINLLNEEERAYLVYKGFAIYGKEHEIFKHRLPEIKFNHGAENHTMVKEILEFVWSRSNYDVFGELMGYLK